MKIGTMELVVILLVAFLVLGPEKTALYTKKLGKSLRALRIYINSFTEDFTETVTEPLQDLQQPLEELRKPLEESVQAVRKPMDELQDSLRRYDAKLRTPSKPKTETQAPTETEEEPEEAIPVAEATQE